MLAQSSNCRLGAEEGAEGGGLKRSRSDAAAAEEARPHRVSRPPSRYLQEEMLESHEAPDTWHVPAAKGECGVGASTPSSPSHHEVKG